MIPEGWVAVGVEDLAEKGQGAFLDGDWIESKDQDENGGIRLFQVGNVMRGWLKTGGSLRWVNEETVRRLKCTVLRPDDILIARMPDPIGRACLVPNLPYSAITAVDCAILRVERESVDPRFVVHYLNSNQHLSAVASHVTGSTRQRISRANLARLPVFLPPLPEQQKIAAILSSVDAAIEATEAVIAQLQVVKKAMMAELLTRGIPGRHERFKMTEIGEVPEEWEVVPGELLFKLAGGYGPTDVHFSSSGRALFLKVDDFNLAENRRGLKAAALRFDPAANPRIKAYPPASLVFPKRGAAIFKNRVQLLAQEATVDPNLMVLLPGPKLDPGFFVHAMLQIGLHNLSDNSGIPQINNKHLYPHCFRVPSLPEQVAVRESLDEVSTRTEVEELCKATLLDLKTALMSVLLTGEVRVKPDDAAPSPSRRSPSSKPQASP